MIIPMLCVTIFVILVVWFLLPRVARLMIHTPTAISIFVCLSMVQLMAVFISMRCTLCGHFLQVALTLILVVGYAIAASYAFLGTINPDTNKIPKHLFQGYLNIYNNYFKAPWMPDRTEANPNELNQDDARYGFRCCHLKNIWTAP